MDSPFLQPSFLFTVGSGFVFLILWFARLEFKANANKERIDENKTLIDTEIKNAKIHREKLETRIDAHISNAQLHHNDEAQKEFKNLINLRFTQMETALTEIKVKLDRMVNK